MEIAGIIQVAGIGIIAIALIILLKPQRPEMALAISIMAGVIIFLFASQRLLAVINYLQSFVDKAGINPTLFKILLKIIGVAYIAEFTAEICRDAGDNSIASKVELAGKTIIFVLAIPILASLMDLITRIMN